MPRFVAVIHSWFMDSNGFHVEEIDAENMDRAQVIADALAHRRNVPFNDTAAHVLEIGPDMRISPRRLTWRERLSGRINAPAPAPMMTGMIEIVANAIWQQPLDRLAEADGPRHPRLLGVARAAIQAMKEPNNRMLRAAAKAMSPSNRPTPEFVSNQKKHAIRYRAMIDAALGGVAPHHSAAATEGSADGN